MLSTIKSSRILGSAGFVTLIAVLLLHGDVNSVRAASAYTVTFTSLSGATGTPFFGHQETGFSVTPVLGNWQVLATHGNPAPAIQFVGPTLLPTSSTVEISAGGAFFTFTSVDLYASISSIPYVFTGTRNGATVFQVSNVQPLTFGNFVTVANPHPSDVIDTLTITLTAPALPALNPMGLDNIAIQTANAVVNGSFTSGLPPWVLFATPDVSYIGAEINGGVLNFWRVPPPPGTMNQAVVLQNTGMTLAAGTAVTSTFALGNSGALRRRIVVLIHDLDFSDLQVCTFWLAPSQPLTQYTMRTHTTDAWQDATISFYAATAGVGVGAYLVDDVTMVYTPLESNTRTDCVDPTAPPPPGGADGPEMLSNGDFGSGSLPPWTLFGTIVGQIAGGVFEFVRPDATPPSGVVLQATGLPITAGDVVTATFDFGNTSGVRKRVTVLLHDLDFSDLTACTFWLPPASPLATFTMRTTVPDNWDNATFSVYPSTIGVETWTRLDNASVRRTPAVSAFGTQCVEPN